MERYWPQECPPLFDRAWKEPIPFEETSKSSTLRSSRDPRWRDLILPAPENISGGAPVGQQNWKRWKGEGELVEDLKRSLSLAGIGVTEMFIGMEKDGNPLVLHLFKNRPHRFNILSGHLSIVERDLSHSLCSILYSSIQFDGRPFRV